MKRRHDSRRKETSETPRQTLIAFAAVAMRRHNISAPEALESIVDVGRAGTLGGAMRVYYLKVSDVGLERLIKAVERTANA